MINYLKEYNITEETIEGLKKSYYEELIDMLSINQFAVRKVIEYLRNLGVKDFNQIILYNLPIFLADYDYVKECFEKVNDLKKTIDMINEDYMYIHEVVEY